MPDPVTEPSTHALPRRPVWLVRIPGATDLFARTYGEHAERLANAVMRELVAIEREKGKVN